MRWQVLFNLLGAVWLVASVALGREPPRFVVVLYPEANNGSPGNAAADRGIRDTFLAALGNNVEVHNEYLDVSRFPDDDYQADLAKFLRRKYDGRKVDLVIAGLASGLDYAVRYRDELFSDAPIVFCAVDEKELAKRDLPKSVYGVPIHMDIADSLDVGLTLLPQTNHVYVVVGKSAFDQHWEAEARKQLHPFEDRVQISFLPGLPMAELLELVEKLPKHSLVYYLHVFQDGDGKVYVPAEALGLIAAKSKAPIFSHVDTYVGRGIVGGRVFSFEQAGRSAAERGIQLLTGETPVANGARGENRYVFDAQQLRRWNIVESAVPRGSDVRFKSPTMWEAYRWQISIVAAVFVMQGLLILGLIIERVQRTKAEAASRAAQSRLYDSQGTLRELTGKLLGAEEAERRRIARELHDDLGQGLALLSVEMDLLQQKAPRDGGLSGAHIEKLSGRVKELSSSVHDLSHQLHPMKLEQLGVVAAVGGLCKALADSHRVAIQFQHDELPKTISPATAFCLYRIAQEGLQNVIKHSQASRTTVSLKTTADSIVLTIADDGRGFELAEARLREGIGLAGMRERVHLVNGQIVIESGVGQGTSIQVHVPLNTA